MIPEIGHFVLWLALGIATLLGAVPMVGAQKGRADWIALARPVTVWQFKLVAISYVCLSAAFVPHAFSVRQGA